MEHHQEWAKHVVPVLHEMVQDSDESKALRLKNFRAFDNGNGLCSRAEVDRGILNLKLDAVFKAKPAIGMAFEAAKDSKKSDNKTRNDYIELGEFRTFIESLIKYYRYYVRFCHLDANNCDRISLEEFAHGTGGQNIDSEAVFKAIDKNNEGKILFGEWCAYNDDHLDMFAYLDDPERKR